MMMEVRSSYFEILTRKSIRGLFRDLEIVYI